VTVRILNGDCRDVLRTLPDESVHCVVTSPPYWGLRDYGVDGQIGLLRSFINELIRRRRNYARVTDPDQRGVVQFGIALFEDWLISSRGVEALKVGA
jgi:DNA modification methylase